VRKNLLIAFLFGMVTTQFVQAQGTSSCITRKDLLDAAVLCDGRTWHTAFSMREGEGFTKYDALMKEAMK
jgi:hypothetical protein